MNSHHERLFQVEVALDFLPQLDELVRGAIEFTLGGVVPPFSAP